MRLIDADAAKCRVADTYFDTLIPAVNHAFDDSPTVDAVPVVRCKDCKHLRPNVDAYTQETVGYWCSELDIGSVDVDDFCSRGERKEVTNA